MARVLRVSALSLALLLAAAFEPRPVHAQAQQVVRQIGVNVEDLYDLDMGRGTFGATVWDLETTWLAS